jgi:hypothetical protein
MTGQDLLDELRNDILDDASVPYLWNDPFLLRILNRAEQQACRRSYLLTDSTTIKDGVGGTSGDPVTQITIVPNTGTYTLSKKVLQIKRVKLSLMAEPLLPTTRDELDSLVYSWETASGTAGTAGTAGGDPAVYPTHFLSEVGNELVLIKTPTINDTVSMVVSRLPLFDFTLKTSPEIDPKHHDGLLDWAAHLAYMKNDSDTLNMTLAVYYEKKFTERFGPLPDAYAEKMRRELPRRQRMRVRTFGD